MENAEVIEKIQKTISPTEPIVGFYERLSSQYPHAVLQVEQWRKDVLYCTCVKTKDKVEIPYTTVQRKEFFITASDYLLVQRKPNLIKIKDVKTENAWETGKDYETDFKESIRIPL